MNFEPKRILLAEDHFVSRHLLERNLTNWGFQAQDGSFLGRMIVSGLQSYIRFLHFRANDQWPQVSCSTPVPDPRDSRDGIDKVP